MVQNRHIVFISDDNYIMPTAVAIKSLFMNIVDQQQKYIIHLFTEDISEESEQLLQSSVESNGGLIIHRFDRNFFRDRNLQINQNTHVSPIALLKFEIANILDDVDMALYLDSDIIANGDISSIFDIDISDYYVAACYELWHYIDAVYKNKEAKIGDFYFNSGVMLLNLKLIRNESLDKKLWRKKLEMYNSNHRGSAMDQDTLNYVFQNRVYKLPIKYNCNSHFTKNIDINIINRVYSCNYRNLDDMKTDLIFIHYVGKNEKPWLFSNGACCEIWDKYYCMFGWNLKNLKRKVLKKDLNYFWYILIKRINSDGIIGAFKYFIFRLKSIEII